MAIKVVTAKVTPLRLVNIMSTAHICSPASSSSDQLPTVVRMFVDRYREWSRVRSG